MPTLVHYQAQNPILMWEKWQAKRVEALSDDSVRKELRYIMHEINYSWHSISHHLQREVDLGMLQIGHFEPDNLIYEWNVLCDEKQCWKNSGRPSFLSFRFNRDCLIKLKTIPVRAGLGIEGTFSNSYFVVKLTLRQG